MSALSVLATSVGLPLLTLAQPASAAVTVGSNISVFPDRDMVVAVGYNAGEELLVEVLRNDVVIGTTRGPAVETPEGTGLEVNHGPLGTAQPGDCWDTFTPNIIGGDVIRVTPTGRPDVGVDTMTVQDNAFSGDPVENPDGSVSVSGTATPGTDFAVEFRRDKPDPRFRGGPFVPIFEAGTNKWTATFRPAGTVNGLNVDQQRQIALNEASWLAVADNVTDTTLAELGEAGGPAAGCPGTADPNSIVGGLAPITITSGNVTFSGTARAGVAAVTVTVGALGTREATLTPDPNGGPGTWTLPVPKTDLEALPEGNVLVRPHFDTLTGATRTVIKDTVAPLAPTPSVLPGTYSTTQAVALNKPAGEGTSKVYWEIGNAGVPDPDAFSNLYTSQVSVTSTQTLKARVIDQVGNLGAVGSFDYRIGNPPAAPTNLTGTESTTAAGRVNLQWSPASGATGYNVYNGGIKVNATPLTGTSYTDAAGLGQHTYVVRAVEANGIESVDSNVATVTVAAPDVPTGLRATEGDARVTLNWTAVTGAARYRVYRDGVAIASEPATNSYIDANRINGTLYEYAISALDAGGNESPRTGVVQAVPQVPADTTPPPAPTVSPATGTYTATQSVTMADAEAGAVIRYTVGTGTTVPADPIATDTQYTGAISVSASQVIKAAAFDAVGNRSAITQRNYTITTPPPAGGTRTVTIDASADTTVRQDQGTTTGGSATTLRADTQSVEGNAATRARSYLRFVVPALATGESITGARVSLNVTNATGNGPALRRTATTWTESSMTYNAGQPAISSTTVVANFGAMATGRVTTAVSGITTAGTVSFQVEPEGSDGLDFSSRETANRPQLVLTISTGGTTPPPAGGDTTPPPAPAVNPASGTFTSAQTVTATNTEAGVTHRYTVGNGTTVPGDPTGTSTALPAGGLTVSASSVVKVAAFDAAGNRSPITQRNYTITTPAPTGGTRTVTINASADTTVRQDQGTTTGGSATTLRADTQSVEGNAATRARSYLRFVVPALAAGESITGASLSLNVTNATGNGPALRRTATTWTESSMTYNAGQPALSSTTVVANYGAMATGRVSTAVSGITGAGTVSFQVEAEGSDGLDFSSRETTNRPQLVLTIRTP